jgi:hypothetical protein
MSRTDNRWPVSLLDTGVIHGDNTKASARASKNAGTIPSRAKVKVEDWRSTHIKNRKEEIK